MRKAGGMWSCCRAEGTLLGAAELGCEQTAMQKPSTGGLSLLTHGFLTAKEVSPIIHFQVSALKPSIWMEPLTQSPV